MTTHKHTSKQRKKEPWPKHLQRAEETLVGAPEEHTPPSLGWAMQQARGLHRAVHTHPSGVVKAHRPGQEYKQTTTKIAITFTTISV